MGVWSEIDGAQDTVADTHMCVQRSRALSARLRPVIEKSVSPTRLLTMLVVMMGLLAAGAASASAATYTWLGGSGSYTDPAKWGSSDPGSLPGPSDDVFITAAGDYTVNYFGPPGVQRSVGSLTLGNASSGTQRLLIKTANGSGDGRLEVQGSTTITSHGQAILDQDSTGLSATGNLPQLNFHGPASNAGLILARHEGSVENRTLSTGPGTITNTGTIHVQSGQLNIRHVVNTGNVVVDAGARLYVDTGSQEIGITHNSGTVTNNGDIYLYTSGWAQNGGSITGNPVRIFTGRLADSAGTGSFIVMGNGNKISGTVPAGQTVQFGSPADEMSNFMNIQPGGFTVAPGGTLVIAPPPANGAEVLDNPLTVNGTLQIKAGTTHAIVSAGMTVGAGGAVDVQNGELLLRQSPVNHGTVTIAPGARVQLSGDGFTSDGTLNFQIASPTSFGAITRISAATTNLGGTANGVLTGGYVPAAGTAFKVIDSAIAGVFGAVGGGFTAVYAGDKTSASLVYGAPAGGGGTGGGGTGPVITPPKPPVRCIVPKLKNKTLKSATSALKKANCALGTVTRPRGRKARRAATRVVGQSKKAGAVLAKGSKVGVTMGKPAKKKAKHKKK
jgi:hypothetical protein